VPGLVGLDGEPVATDTGTGSELGATVDGRELAAATGEVATIGLAVFIIFCLRVCWLGGEEGRLLLLCIANVPL